MLLHDLSDPLLELAKLLIYTRRLEPLADACFAAFMLTFIYTRTYLFPRYIVMSYRRFPQISQIVGIIYDVQLWCMYALWALHVYWSLLVPPPYPLLACTH